MILYSALLLTLQPDHQARKMHFQIPTAADVVITPNSRPGQTQTILKLQIFAAQPLSSARASPGPFHALTRPCSRPDKI
jgi:hypothetical protein